MTGGGKVRTAVHWSLLGTFGSEILGLTFLVVLARLLTNEDYGVVAVLGAVLAIAMTIVSAGLGRTLVQRPTLNADEETTAFVIQICLGLAVTALLFAMAPWIADFYGDPRLVELTQVAALRPLLSSFTPIQQALMERDLDFRTKAIVEVVANLAAGGLAITLAFLGFGPWALVAQMLVWAGGRSAMLWALRPWRPNGSCTRAAARALLPYSWRLMASSLVHTVFEELHTLAIGRLLGFATLGLYNRARYLQTPLTAAMGALVQRVSFSAYARLQDDRPHLISAHRTAMRLLSTANAPMMLGLAAIAPALVPAVLSDHWTAAGPLLQGFACFGLASPLAAQAQQLLGAIGRADLVLRFAILRHSLSIVLLVITWSHGPLAIILGLVANVVIELAVSALVVRRLLGYRLSEFVADLLPGTVAGLAAGGAAMGAGCVWAGTGLALVAVQILAGVAAWLGIIIALRRSVFSEAWNELSRLLRRPG